MLNIILTLVLGLVVLSMASGKKPYGGIKGSPYRIALEGAQVTEGTAPVPPVKEKSSKKGATKDKFTLKMALIKWSGMGATSASGKVGGSVVTPGGSAGAFWRNWVKPRNGRTVTQQFVRSVLAGISSAFRSLTSDQVQAWKDAANSENPTSIRRNAFGDIKVMSGSQLFQKVNNILLSLGLTTVSDVPANVATDTVTGVVINSSAGGGTITLDVTLFSGGAALPADTYMKVYGAPQRSNGRSYLSPSSLRYLGNFVPTDSVTAMDIASMYFAKFGTTLVAGQKISVATELITSDGATTFAKTGRVYATAQVGA